MFNLHTVCEEAKCNEARSKHDSWGYLYSWLQVKLASFVVVLISKHKILSKDFVGV